MDLEKEIEITNICCIGAGFVGGPTMAVIALKCPEIKITVVDKNFDRINQWNGPTHNLPVFEPGLSEIIESVRGKNLFFSQNIPEAINESQMIFIAVNTPTKKEGEGAGMAADLQFVEASAKEIAKYSKTNKIVIEKSTLPVRTAEKIKEILSDNSLNVEFEVLSNPEFLAEGTAINDLFKSDRVLIGGDQNKKGIHAIQTLTKIYSRWIPEEKIYKTNVWSSELAKLASNAFLAQRISSINSLTPLCESTGANIIELSNAIGLDTRIGKKFLKPSPGFGGSCFKKDILNLIYLLRFYKHYESADYWEGVLKINDYQTDRLARKIIKEAENQKIDLKLSLLGWSFKQNTNDSRESPSIYVAKKLLLSGYKLSVYDPKVDSNTIIQDMSNVLRDERLKEEEINYYLSRISIEEDSLECLRNTSIITILTEWDEFKNYDWSTIYKKCKKPVKIFDSRLILEREKILNAGFKLYQIGI